MKIPISETLSDSCRKSSAFFKVVRGSSDNLGLVGEEWTKGKVGFSHKISV